MKRCLIIGAGEEQLFFIKEAQKDGNYVITIDGNPKAVGFEVADESYVVDLKDELAVLDLVKKLDIDIVVPVPIGFFVTLIGAINEELNLKGINRVQVETLANKECFLSFQKENNFFNPKEKVILKPSIKKLQKAIKSVGEKCVLRPAKGSGSRGVVVCEWRDTSLIEGHLSSLLQNEASLVSEYLEGDEYGIDIVVHYGKVNILTIREKEMTDLPYRQETGFIINNDPFIKSKIVYEVQRLVDLLQIDYSIMHADILIHLGRVYIIETAPRPSGLGIHENLISEVFEESIVQAYLGCFFGMSNTNFNKKEDNISNVYGLFFWDFKKVGIIHSINHCKEDMVKHKINFHKQDSITEIRQGKDLYKRGFFVICNKNKEELIKQKTKILEKVVVIDEE